jgi:hypothetical protein
MANRCAAPLVVVHSWHDGHGGHDRHDRGEGHEGRGGDHQPRIEAQALVEQGLARWRAKYPQVRADGRTAGGPPAVVLPALTHEAGLLVVGSGTSGVATLAIRYAHCPVLVATS